MNITLFLCFFTLSLKKSTAGHRHQTQHIFRINDFRNSRVLRFFWFVIAVREPSLPNGCRLYKQLVLPIATSTGSLSMVMVIMHQSVVIRADNIKPTL